MNGYEFELATSRMQHLQADAARDAAAMEMVKALRVQRRRAAARIATRPFRHAWLVAISAVHGPAS